jgi:nitronate monooxygenase
MLGADGAVVGTRFWASEEALTPKAATDRAVRATGDDTVRSKAFDAVNGVPWPDDFSFRVVKNAFAQQWAHREAEAAAAFGSLAAAYGEARARLDFDVLPVVAGECVGLIRDRPASASIVEAMVSEASALLSLGTMLDFRKRTANVVQR